MTVLLNNFSEGANSLSKVFEAFVKFLNVPVNSVREEMKIILGANEGVYACASVGGIKA